MQAAVLDRPASKGNAGTKRAVWLPEHIVEVAGTWLDDTLVVGHEPFMSRFVSRLVLGREQPTIVDFTPGTIVCLARRPVTGAWCIGWMLVPEVLRG